MPYLAEDPEKKMMKDFLSGNMDQDDEEEEEDDEYGGDPDGGLEDWMDMPCYRFNPRLPPHLDDRRCVHCHKYLTISCPHIDEIMDEADVDVDD